MADFHYKDAGCSGPDLVPGAARGNRTWFLGQDGFLRGVTYRQPWVDGENVARCLVARAAAPAAAVTGTGMCADTTGWTLGGVHFPTGNQPPTTLGGWVWQECGGVDPDCACGFYAYHQDGIAGYGFTGAGHRIAGVIEGYGRVVLGTQGFRASKARILALVKPTITQLQREQWHERKDIEKSIKKIDSFLAVPFGPCTRIMAVSVAVSIVGYAVSHVWSPAIAASSAALCVGGFYEAYSRRAWRRDRNTLNEMRATLLREREAIEPTTLPEAVDRMVQNYPSVPMYHDRAAMWADFPVPDLKYLIEGEPS